MGRLENTEKHKGMAGFRDPQEELPRPPVLVVNRGSSSLKFALYAFPSGETAELLVKGKVDRIGQPGTWLELNDLQRREQRHQNIAADGHGAAARRALDWLDNRIGLAALGGIGHRVVHGGPRYWQPQRVTPELLDELRKISPFDPEHLPMEINLIELFHSCCSDVPQVACFDTGFHHDMPRVAQLLPIPRRFDRMGVRRYGFHGLSYAYLMEELARVAGTDAAEGRVILAHFGAGASLAAVHRGRSIDTSMGFTPTAGIPMSTRSGDLDPGLAWFLARTEQFTPEDFHDMVNRHSGLLGVSEISSDVRDLLARETEDERAAEALELFCYQAKKWIGGLAVALGGLDTLIFSGGIGENSPPIRARICRGLGLLGIELSETRNQASAPVISAASSRVTVRVIRTDEERMIARETNRVLAEEFLSKANETLAHLNP